MMRLSRRLALWGGAAAIAAGGFAFMASGVTNASSASEGDGGVTGYTASGIHYTLGSTNTCVNTNDGGNQESFLCALTFTLTSVAVTTTASTVPAHVEAYLEKDTPTKKEITGTNSFTSCSLVGTWTDGNGTTPGHGTYKCTFLSTEVLGTGAHEWHIATIGNVDIEANQ